MKMENTGREEVFCLWFVCPKCKEDCITSDDNFCSNCGHKLSDDEKKQMDKELDKEIEKERDEEMASLPR